MRSSADAKLDDVFLPPAAQPGDWCLMHTRHRSMNEHDSQMLALTCGLRVDRIVLIAREHSQDPGYPSSVIGKGLIDSDWTYLSVLRPEAAEFNVHLDNEDAIVLGATSSMIDGSGGLESP